LTRPLPPPDERAAPPLGPHHPIGATEAAVLGAASSQSNDAGAFVPLRRRIAAIETLTVAVAAKTRVERRRDGGSTALDQGALARVSVAGPALISNSGTWSGYVRGRRQAIFRSRY